MRCLHLVKPGGPWMAQLQVPLPALLLWIRPPAKQRSFSRGPGTVPAYPWAVGFSSLSDHWIIQTSHHILPWEPGVTHPLDRTVLVTHSPWLFTLFPSATPMRLCMGCCVLPPQAVNIRDSQATVNLICPVSGVLCVAIPITPGQDPSLTNRVNRR